MKARSSLPEVPRSALRDHGTSRRVERVWKRLEQELRIASPRSRSPLWWAPAAVVIVFGAGVFVGAHWARPAPRPVATLAPEPPETVDAPKSRLDKPGGAAVVDPNKRNRADKHARDHAVLAAPSANAAGSASAAPQAQAAPVSTTPDWERLANQAEFKAARLALEKQGGFDQAMKGASAEQLMSLAEIARFGQPRALGRAVQALRRVLSNYPNDLNASTAAYTLANLLDKTDDHSGAAKAFATYLSLSPDGDFAEDALGREFEIAAEQHNLELARKLANQYAKDFPKGRRGGEIRAELAKLAGDAGARPKEAESDAGSPAPALDDGDHPASAASGAVH
jgi:TolA-binding protein